MNVAVVGGSGYAGGELLRFLAQHPKYVATVITAGSHAGALITSVHPQLQSYDGTKFSKLAVGDLNNCELIFIALPHGESAKLIRELDSKIKVVDLGADFRLTSEAQWKKYYNQDYAGSLPYGLPELADKKIYEGNRISNPGCYATAISLGVAPLLAIPEVDTSDIVVVAASGTTGAGRNAKVNLLGSEVMNNLTSYKFGGRHQHIPEIEQQLTELAKKKVFLSFTPILAPMPRGILATISCKYSNLLDEDKLKAIFKERYSNSKFLHILNDNLLPSTAAVNGTNHVQIQVAVDSHASRVIVSVALDNLGKGAAGQAIQNANLMCGLPEETGLLAEGVK
jgi:N-acetyl-gamma-glutamyl-phosphate reductase